MENEFIKRLPFWKWALLLIGMFVIFIGLMSVSWSIDGIHGNSLWSRVAVALVSSSFFILIYSLLVKRIERRRVKEFSIFKMGKHLSAGFLVGLLFMSVSIGIMAILGCYRLSAVQWNARYVFISLISYWTVAVTEEIAFRGVVFRMIDERWNVGVALVFSALLFGLMHLMNSNSTLWSAIAIALEAGVLLGAAYKMSGTLWMPIGIHWAWNFAEGTLFGMPVSGVADEYALITPTISGTGWITGGPFGLEASLVTVMVGMALTFLFLFYWRKSKQR